MSLSQILQMGGYGQYVWSAYGISLLVFILNFLLTLRETHQVKKTIKYYLRK